MTNLTNIFASAQNKMLAIYKRNPSDKSATSLLKGLTFSCDSLGVMSDNNTINLYDKDNANTEQFTFDTANLISADCTQKADKYGAYTAKIKTSNAEYVIKFA